MPNNSTLNWMILVIILWFIWFFLIIFQENSIETNLNDKNICNSIKKIMEDEKISFLDFSQKYWNNIQVMKNKMFNDTISITSLKTYNFPNSKIKECLYVYEYPKWSFFKIKFYENNNYFEINSSFFDKYIENFLQN